MFSRKRKREASLTEISEDIAKFFADIKDPCGFKCVPNLKVDVRDEDVLVIVNNIEQIELDVLCQLCGRFKGISDVYCDLLTKSVCVVVERTETNLLASHVYSTYPKDEKHVERHDETQSLCKNTSTTDYARLSELVTMIKKNFGTGGFNSMALEVINRPGIITCHATNIRKVHKNFIFDVCKRYTTSKNVIDFEHSLLRFDIEKVKKPTNVVI
jgi:hypothetical protein